jgi:hypothetical protein
VYAQCEECVQATLREHHSLGASGSDSHLAPPSPRSMLKKSVSSLSGSTFSFIGNDMLESARVQSASGSGPTSVGSSGVFVPRPADKDGQGRGWNWRAGLPESATGQDVLRMLRLGLARGLSFGALGTA